MADAPTAPAVEDDLGDGESQDRITLLKTGRARFLIDGTEYVLKRPNLGQYRDLNDAWEDVTDKLDLLQTGYERQLAEVRAGAVEIEQMEPGPEKDEREMAYRRTLAGMLRKLNRDAEDIRIAWWTQVFRTLALGRSKGPGKGNWPTWVVDVQLPHTLRQHWRTAPLDRG